MRNKFISWLAIFLSLFVMNQSAGMVHAHSESLDVSIPVQVKTVGVPAPKGELLFVLSPLDDAPAPASDQIRIAAGNNGIMPAIAFERPGTYAYHLQVSVVDSKKSSIVGISDFRMEITVYNEKVNTEAGSASKLGAVIVASNWNQSADRQPKYPVTVVLKDKVYPTKAPVMVRRVEKRLPMSGPSASFTSSKSLSGTNSSLKSGALLSSGIDTILSWIS